MSHTTIRVSEDTYIRLKHQGLAGDSFDFVIRRILDQISKKENTVSELDFQVGSHDNLTPTATKGEPNG